MTYNVFGGTLNPAQSIQSDKACDIIQLPYISTVFYWLYLQNIYGVSSFKPVSQSIMAATPPHKMTQNDAVYT